MNVTKPALARIGGLVLCAISCAALASEGGTGNYAFGAQTVATAYLPALGTTEFYNYIVSVHDGSFRDASGSSSIPQFDAQIVAAAPRILHTWGTYRGASLASGGFAEAIYARVAANGQSDHAVGMDMVGVEPLLASIGVGDVQFMLGTVIYIPVGKYHQTSLANSSTHYASAALQGGLTWTPSGRWDLSLNPNVIVNARNNATGYHSGAVAGLTGGASWRPVASDLRWQVGVNGYYEQQFTDDRQNGSVVADGFRLRKQSVGPQIAFWPTPASVWMVKWQHEFDVRNGTQGELVWLECAFPL